MNKFNWRAAFANAGGEISQQQRRQVIDRIPSWVSDWHIEYENYYIVRVEDGDGDAIWDADWDSDANLEEYFSSRFIEWMDQQFGHRKVKVVVGNSTILPLPGDSPHSSSKGATPSSSF